MNENSIQFTRQKIAFIKFNGCGYVIDTFVELWITRGRDLMIRGAVSRGTDPGVYGKHGFRFLHFKFFIVIKLELAFWSSVEGRG